MRPGAGSGARAWYVFRSNPLAISGLVIVSAIVILAVFADFLAPYPAHVGPTGDFGAMNAAAARRHTGSART